MLGLISVYLVSIFTIKYNYCGAIESHIYKDSILVKLCKLPIA